MLGYEETSFSVAFGPGRIGVCFLHVIHVFESTKTEILRPNYCNTSISVIHVDQGAHRHIIREYVRVFCQRSRHSHIMIVRLVVKLAAIIMSYAIPCQCHISEYFVPTSKAACVRHQARKRASKGDQCVSACVAGRGSGRHIDTVVAPSHFAAQVM